MSSLRIFIVESDEIIRSVITAVVESHSRWKICGEAVDGHEAAEKISQHKPDVVLVDAEPSELNGLEVTRQVVRTDPGQKVIIIGLSDMEQVVREAFEAGAMGYVPKANITRDLIPAIKALHNGRTFFTPRIAESILQDCLTGKWKKDSGESKLTEHQRDVVRRLAGEVACNLGPQRPRKTLSPAAAKYVVIAALVIATTALAWSRFHRTLVERFPLLDETLVRLGLKTPLPAAYQGKPDTRVWIDLHTGLYYCPGADLYGRTPRGKFAQQRDAQMDHFEPAGRKVCD